MGIDENGVVRCFLSAKPCDYCETSAALLFCRTDKAFMCIRCDGRVHGTSGLQSRHERVWMCEVCEQAPASVTCKADAASLCVTCDRDIHSANPLARRHERVPVVPFYEDADSVVKSTAAFLVPTSDVVVAAGTGTGGTPQTPYIHTDVNILKVTGDAPEIKVFDGLFSDQDQLLDFDYPVPTATRHQYHHHQHDSPASDSVVPVQSVKQIIAPEIVEQSPEIRFEIDFTRSTFNSYNNYAAQSLSQSVSSSSMDVGVVPDGNSISDISYPFALQLNNSIEPTNSTTPSQPMQVFGLDREARVMRYREKRKNRKFEKTIRYASRKAYAETRPRIKGRFAKRIDTDNDVDRWFIPNSTGYIGDSKYGVVPSF